MLATVLLFVAMVACFGCCGNVFTGHSLAVAIPSGSAVLVSVAMSQLFWHNHMAQPFNEHNIKELFSG
jgi:hypothetical protein